MANTTHVAAGDKLRGEWYRAPQFADAIAKDDGVIKLMAASHDKLRTGYEGIVKARNTPDPTRTDDGHFVDVYARAQRWRDAVANDLSRARETAQSEIVRLDKEIVEKLAIKDGPYGTELRAHFKALDNNQRVKEIEAAIEQGDAGTLGAILAAPARLSGLTDEQQSLFRNRYAERHATDLIQRKSVIAQAMGVNSDGFNEALIALGKLCPKERYESIRARQNEAQSAKDQFVA